MRTHGLEPIPQFPAAGRYLDLALPEHKIDIEVDGVRYHMNSAGNLNISDIQRESTPTVGVQFDVTSDDIFDYMLNLRVMNQAVDDTRQDIAKEYISLKHSKMRLRSMADYEAFSQYYEAKNSSQRQYIDRRLVENIRTQSNGESALYYFSNKIRENALYLLDEPENSLSPEKQIKLVRFLEDFVRFFNCQFVIATHSPFLLSMRGAKIYDLDSTPAVPRRWTDLPNVWAYCNFFQDHAPEF